MEAVKQTSYQSATGTMETPLIDSNWRTQRNYTRDEFMDELAKRLGKHYGMADIRDAQ